MELEGETTVEGRWVDVTVGLDGVRADVAMMRAPDGNGRVEPSRFHTPPAVRAEPEDAPSNALGLRRIMFAEAIELCKPGDTVEIVGLGPATVDGSTL